MSTTTPTTSPRRPAVHVKCWQTGAGFTIRPDGDRTLTWAIALVLGR